MRLYEEVFKSVNGEAISRCLFVPKGDGYFEGVKSVDDFSNERIVIGFSKNRVEIVGEAFSIGKYCDGDLHLLGRIVQIRVLQDGEKV